MAAPSYLAWLVSALLVPCVRPQRSPVPVTTSAGPVLGKISSVVVDGREVQVQTFWGIPYAKPPIGVWRFHKTLDVEPWAGVRNAWHPPKACMQKVDNNVITSPDQMSEDCLYLNIWSPYCSQTNMATMVWIHGGSLKSGTSTDPLYNGAKLAARECVIVASMNYRLGIFGFLHQPVVETNVGLYDVLYALRFLKRNIHVFGGNNSSITLFGSGAGAYIVSTFLMSDLRRDLFSNAILQSGSPSMQMMYQSSSSAMEAKNEVARYFNCTGAYISEFSCLRNVNATDLLNAYYTITGSMRFQMVSVSDGLFLRWDPSEYLKLWYVKNCSILVGTNKDEGTESLIKLLPRYFNTSIQEPPVLTEQIIDRTLTGFLGMLYKAPYLPHIVTALKLIYNYSRLITETTNPSLHFLSNICRDLAYTCPQQKLIDTYTQLGHKVYVYSFDRAPSITNLPAWVGATHSSEIRYIFGYAPRSESENFVEEEVELSKKMMKLWADFARNGDPTPQRQFTPQWRPYMPGNNIMDFTEQAIMMPTMDHKRRCHYWNSIPDEMKN